jgi:hypothetical protein
MAKTQTIGLGKKGSFKVHKGALHRALGVPEGEKIPASKMAKGKASSNPHVRAMVRSAKGLKAMHHGGSRKSSRS